MENDKAEIHTWKGWFPVHRMDLQIIRQNFGADRRYEGVRIVFDALCDMANARRRATFEAPINLIAHVAGVKYKTAQARLRDLEGCGLVKIQNPRGALDTPREYTLLGEAGAELSREHSAPSNGDFPGVPTGSKPENTPPPAPPIGAELLHFVFRFRKIRAEFADARLQDFQIADAVRCCPPGPDRERGFTDFERDAATALTCPDNPLKMLRGYMAQAAEGPKQMKGKHNGTRNRNRGGEYAEPVKPLPRIM